MLIRDLKTYVDAASDDQEIGVVLHSVDTGCEITATFDVVVYVSEYGELLICIMV